MGAIDLTQGPVHAYAYEPCGQTLYDFNQCWAPYSLCSGPLGSGKTACAIDKAQLVINSIPPDASGVRRSRGFIIRNFENDLRSSTIKDWLEMMPEHLGKMRWTSPITHTLMYRGEDGIPVHAEVLFLAFDNPRSEKKLRSTQFTWGWVEEGKEVPQVLVNAAFSRLGRYPSMSSMPVIGYETRKGQRVPVYQPYWSGGWMTTNKWDEGHWLEKLTERPTPDQAENWEFFDQPPAVVRNLSTKRWEVNPNADNLANLKAEYYPRLIGSGATDSWISVNLGNLKGTVVDGEPVWPEYNPYLHETADEDYDPNQPVYAGADFGRKPAMAFAQERNGGYVIFDEVVLSGASAATLGEEAAVMLAREYGLRPENVTVYGDPAGLNLTENSDTGAIQLLCERGFICDAAPISNKNLAGRRLAMTGPMKRLRSDGLPALLIHKRCRILRQAAAGHFQYRKMQVAGTQRYTVTPDKNDHSHIAEAAEYLMAGLGEGLSIDVAERASSDYVRREYGSPWSKTA